MINRLIWEILSTDDTDENQTEFEAELGARWPDITDFSNYNYWQSLKTQLGDPNANWAYNKILYRQEESDYLKDIAKDNELPVINISQTKPYFPRDRNLTSFTGEHCLYIATAQSEGNSLDCFKIYKRIKRVLFPEHPSGAILDEYCKSFPNFGINKLLIRLNRVEEFYFRSLKVCLNVEFQEIS